MNVTTEEQRDTLKQLAEENDDWLYSDEAETATLDQLQAKIDGMMAIIEPAEKRYTEWSKRPEMVKSARHYIITYYNATKNASETKPWLADSE